MEFFGHQAEEETADQFALSLPGSASHFGHFACKVSDTLILSLPQATETHFQPNRRLALTVGLQQATFKLLPALIQHSASYIPAVRCSAVFGVTFIARVFYYRTGLPYLIFVSFHQALESLPCPVTILMINCPFDIRDQEDLVQDVRD
ncbi:hypothetical protein T09_14506 [Trichinella sp. T9]|nr:hypothetical protein T09_14506 [Trichinella sp. T9]